MSKRKSPLSSADREENRLLQLGADALATDIENVIAENASVLMQCTLHRMVQQGFTFEEAWADIGKAVLVAHTSTVLFRAGVEHDKYINEHTVSGDLD